MSLSRPPTSAIAIAHRIDQRVAMRRPRESVGEEKGRDVAVSQKSGVVWR